VDIVVNGRTREVPDGSTAAELIETLGMRLRNVVVERNGQPVDRSTLHVMKLEAGDVLEVVRAVQGG
jgi:sulfur carrier protein